MSRWLPALGLAWLLVSADALSQPKPALVRDIDEPGLSPFRESVQVTQSTTTCPPSLASCNVVFSTVPAGKRLVVTYVSTVFFLDSGGTSAEALLTSTGGGFIYLPMPQVQPGIADRYFVSTPVQFYVEPGDAPRITMRGFNFADGRLMSVSVVGYFVTLP